MSKLQIPQWENNAKEVKSKSNIMPSNTIRINKITATPINCKFYAFKITYKYRKAFEKVKTLIKPELDNMVALIPVSTNKKNNKINIPNMYSFVYYVICYGSEYDHKAHQKTHVKVM